MHWIGLSSVLRPCQHSIGYMGDWFTGQKTQPTVSKYTSLQSKALLAGSIWLKTMMNSLQLSPWQYCTHSEWPLPTPTAECHSQHQYINITGRWSCYQADTPNNAEALVGPMQCYCWPAVSYGTVSVICREPWNSAAKSMSDTSTCCITLRPVNKPHHT